ncbi:hypothetical protein GCK32_002359 [Trichostrongylus colubriformis]|uniref:Uncharacterized protein n=1 Tax=Trichostrongylus colubriformis TaxID=6319 RepID=A0AAN8FA36_TRICO
MSNDPNIDPGGRTMEASDVTPFFPDHGQPGPSRDVVTQPQGPFPQYMVTDDNMWIQPLTNEVYEDEYGNYHEIHGIEQQPGEIEEVYLLTDEERDIEMMRNGVGSLQVAAHEVVVDEMLGTSVEPEQYIQQAPTQIISGFPQQYIQAAQRHAVRSTQSQPTMMSAGGPSRVRYIVQHTTQTLEMEHDQPVQYDVRPMAMFEGPSNQALVPQQQQQVNRPVPTIRSRSKSQPRRSLYGELEDESLAYLVQEHDENEWDGVQLEDHEYFVGGQQEREAILNANEDELAQSAVPPPKIIQRPYFPPNLSPTQKKEYLFVNYKKACDRYFPFANVAVLEADTRYKPVEAFASDLYRFHSRGAHIHGFFRTVIDVRDRPSHDQTRYIQDIQFGKVFPLFPDYEEWDDKMRDEFRQLSNRLMRIFERKCFYAQSGGSHGKAPVIKRGPKAAAKPPPNYAEQQKVQSTGIPKGFQPLRASYQSRPGPSKHTLPPAAAIVHPGTSSSRLIPLNHEPALDEPVAIPQDLGASRVEAFEHNKRADIKRIVKEAFVNREPVSQYQEHSSSVPSDSRQYICRVPPGPSKTLRHQRSIASKAIRMIANRSLEPVLDPVTGRYVVSLEDMRIQNSTVPPVETTRRCVPRPVHSLREMADSARRGASTSIQPAWSAAVRPQGARVSRIDQAPRFTYNSAAAMNAVQQRVPSTSTAAKAPLLRNVAAAQIHRRPDVFPENAVPAPRNDYGYPRSHSSGRTAPPSNNYRRSASSGRPITAASRQANAGADIGLDEEVIQVDDDPIMVDNTRSQAQAVMENQTPFTSAQEKQPPVSDQNTAPAGAKVASESSLHPSREQKGEKRIVQVRDEHGFLRRCVKLPDGTLIIRNRTPKPISRLILTRPGTEGRSDQDHARTPTAGAVYAMHSMGRKDERRPGTQPEQQWKRSQASVAPWSHTATVVPQRQEPRHVSNEPVNENRLEQPVKARTKRKDALYSGDDDDIVLISEQSRDKKKSTQRRRSRRPQKEQEIGEVAVPKSRSRTPKKLSRICGAPRPPKTPEQEREALRRRLLKQEEEDSENIIVDVTTNDETLDVKIKELIDSLPPPEPPEVAELLSGERKKAGRPPKKFRGRLAREKQAIRDAEIAEKVAIKQRELPVLDLTLKVIDDPSVELPQEAPIVIDSLAELDTNLIHEVGEVLKELVAKVSLNELRRPRKDMKARTRRCWEHLPERVPSKRQEYRAQKMSSRFHSPPPPPTRSRTRGRNSDKHQQPTVVKTDIKNDGDTSAGSIVSEPTLEKDAATQSSQQTPQSEMTLTASPDVAIRNVKDEESKMAKDIALQVVKEGTTPSSEPAQSREKVRTVHHSPQRPTVSRLRTQSASSSWAQEVHGAGYDDVNLNEDDLVDINIDPFFASTENFDSSASGDETDTPSQNIRKRFREFLGEPGTTAPLSPSKISTPGAVSQMICQEDVIRSSGSVPITPSATTCAQNRNDSVTDKFAGFVEGLVGRTTQLPSLENSQFHISADPIAGPAQVQTSSLVDSSIDVCNKVETMLDVMELSLQNSEAVQEPSDVDLDVNRLQSGFAGENLSSTHQFVRPLIAYDDNTTDMLPGPLIIDELMQEIEAEFCGLNYLETTPSSYVPPPVSTPQHFPPLNLEPLMREPIEDADNVTFEACREDQHGQHLVTIAIPEADTCRMSLPSDVSVELVAPEEDERMKERLNASTTLADYGSITTQWKCSFCRTVDRFSKAAENAKVSYTVRIASQERVMLSVADVESLFCPGVPDPRFLLAQNEFERDHFVTSKTVPLPVLESCSLSSVTRTFAFKRKGIDGDTSHTVSCTNLDFTALSVAVVSYALVSAENSEIISGLLPLRASDSVDLHTTCDLQKPSIAMEYVASPSREDTSDGLNAEDIEWKQICRLKRIDLQKSYAKLSPTDLALLKGDGVRLPASEEDEKVHAVEGGKIAVEDTAIMGDVRNLLEGLVNTTSEDATEMTEQENLCDIPPIVPSYEAEQESVILLGEKDLRTGTQNSGGSSQISEYLAQQSSEARLGTELSNVTITAQAQIEDLTGDTSVATLPSVRDAPEEFVLRDVEFVATEGLFGATEFAIERIVTVAEVLEKCSLKAAVRPRRKHRKRPHKKASQDLTVDYSTNVVTESNKIFEYLRSEDTPDSGFSETTFLEQCYLQSPDLFGIGDGVRRKKQKVSKRQECRIEEVNREASSELSLIRSETIPTRKHVFLQNDVKAALDRLWRRQEAKTCPGRFGALVELCRSKVMNLDVGAIHSNQDFLTAETMQYSPARSFMGSMKSPYSHESSIAIIASRPRNHLISDFNLTMMKPRNPVVRCEADMGPLLASLHSVSPLRLSRPRVEGSLENALAQYDKGVKCVLDQVISAKSIMENIRSTSHWSLHYLMDAQLFVLDVLYELWEYTARSVQLAVFNPYQCLLWEKHHQIFDARMYCTLFEMNGAAALSSKIEICCSYIRRFEEWNRKTNNLSSVYNHVYGLALSMIKLVAIPNAFKQLQAMTQWNSKARPSKSSEQIFETDLIPFFQVGTCQLKSEGSDMENLLDGKESLLKDTLEHLLSFEAAQDNNRADSFCFLFPSHSVVKLCQDRVQKEVSAYFNKHVDDALRVDHHQLSMVSPMARAYILSRVHETRVRSLMRNNIMNLVKIIVKLNGAFDELSAYTEKMNQAEFEYPCGQVVFDFDGGKVSVRINCLASGNIEAPAPSLVDEARRLMGDAVKNTVFDPTPEDIKEKEVLAIRRDRVQKSVDMVTNWMLSIPSTCDDVNPDSPSMDTVIEPMEIAYPSSPARITVIDDEDDFESDGSVSVPRKKKKGPQIDTVTTTIAGRKIQYNVDADHGVLKMKTMDSVGNDASTDDLTATNTLTSASFSSFDRIETLKIIRSAETGEFNWTAMIENALEAAPPPVTLPSFLQKNDSLAYQTIDIMKAHEYANHFIRETDENGEFLDLRKEQREKIRQFQLVDYFERRRNARFEAISSDLYLEMPRPSPDQRDKIPLYAGWLRQVLQFAEIERKRLTMLSPVNHVGRCRAARSEVIREFAVPVKRRPRSASTPSWFGRTIYEHFGEFLPLGMARLEYEIAGRKGKEGQLGARDDTITHYFVSRNNSPSTLVDPLELLANPYGFFSATPAKRIRTDPPLVESSLVKRVHMSDPPVFAPFAALLDEPMYPPCCSDYDSSDEDE